jgi:histidinol-phosphatase (PHP family)
MSNAGRGGQPAPSPRAGDRLDLPLDAHLHTDLSPDADVPIDVYAALAIERGVTELAITDHLDFDPRAPAFEPDFGLRERVVRDAAERWGDRVAIRFGVEITYERRFEDDIRQHLADHRYDYTIGSVHAGADSPYLPDRVGRWIEGRPLPEIVGPYLDEVLAAVRSGLFDTIGHLDYVKRWLVPHVDPSAFAAAPDLYEPVLAAMVEAGVALEVNSSGLRQAAHEAYPAPWVVRRFRELGGGRVTTGTDTHRAHSFGFGLADAYATIAAAGLDVVWIRRGPREARLPVPGRLTPNARE